MVLSIDITPQTEARLREQARAAGKDVGAYVSELVERAAAQSSLDQLLAPLREHFAASGTSDVQLIDEITAAQSAYRNEKHKKTA
jgi:hypothetical protein